VLVIDDNVDLADGLSALLTLSGHEVSVAYDGTSGVAVARASLPQIVLCDLGLPGPDGYDVAKALRAEPALHDAFLVALSGYGRPEDRERSARAGFDRHVTKPPPAGLLQRIIAECPTKAASDHAAHPPSAPDLSS
jgi:CheY-like chemotaxis protein